MLVRVAVGIILRGGEVFIALRNSNQHQGGLWEFPGGKCESSESAETALARELKEECGIAVTESSFYKTISHDYGDKQVELCFYKVTGFDGEPEGSEGQAVSWVAISNLSTYRFPEANQQIVSELMAAV
ncbi:MAG: 8-oxo-dGTP diphosphatase MutT [Gammaproteobacteria bacterium]|jgi:8-oxo-dGTP diphosphatase|uniref:8-oxo-dGTP diphosphatase MutT n=1 Tax=Marinomonas TaxID=28253 RepID=UPI000C2905BA|nr:8-oxo-dGTP diphosphatase MutT [Marinomonas sp. ef1]MBU1296537.1 8-oxo-dGTP diphosphatase MutT [Gammaproteobacteria bacterium]MBU1465664.1 8-oxo-dGTP diphosphatase MutT [Gammaproteobacteria bacterium]MBU2023167.1 8-oxo-dGTP diphosphatase MutT [Gammaproteobacteria bacterium]MBU2236383.1 8-oxo-dGTP diphosphatase MutT [Gammaproteobacteria bacterium]MBU2318364.1 8-oxo-dGTP diphosphatase MutT [Gammaproteobacteria bacterium]